MGSLPHQQQPSLPRRTDGLCVGLWRQCFLQPQITAAFVHRCWQLQRHASCDGPWGTWSETQVHPINVSDITEPLPVITVNNVVVEDNISLLTGQRILFSAGRSVDNVPIEHLDFQWDWGDGTQSGGIGVYSQQHEWDDIDGESETFNLTLTVSDGINVGTKTLLVHINNRVPVQIYAETLTTMTYTSLVLPDVFVDDDGEILTHAWSFPTVSVSGRGRQPGTTISRASAAAPRTPSSHGTFQATKRSRSRSRTTTGVKQRPC